MSARWRPAERDGFGDTCTGTPVRAGASCTVQARFAPTTTGTRTATIDITDDAAGSPHHTTLSGDGT